MGRGMHGLALAAMGCNPGYGHVLGLEGERVQGEVLYDQNCASCHGEAGLGVVGPSLLERLPLLTDEEILLAVEEGPLDMPPFTFSDQELADLLLYLKSEFQ